MNVTHKMNVDLLRPGVEPRIHAVQGDQYTRSVELSLMVGGNAFSLPGGTAAVVRFRKDDGTGGVYNKMPDGTSAYTISGNKVTVCLAPAVLSTPGHVTAAVALSNNGDVLGVFSFRIVVEADPSIGTVESENYFSFETLEDINTALAGFESAIGGRVSKAGDTVGGYLDFGKASNGLKWTTSDGTQILLRPDYDNNIFQIVKKGTDDAAWSSLLTISTDGTPRFPSKPLGTLYGGTGATTGADALANIGGISITKLWENASVGSEMTDGTVIDLSLSGYEWIYIIAQTSTTNTRKVGTIIPVGQYYRLIGLDVYQILSRDFLPQTTGVTVSNPVRLSVYGAATTDAAVLIPYRIFGIKGVK